VRGLNTLTIKIKENVEREAMTKREEKRKGKQFSSG
jgi:hypothetical protein